MLKRHVDSSIPAGKSDLSSEHQVSLHGKLRKTWADVFEEPEDFSAFSEQLPPERSEVPLLVQNAEEEGWSFGDGSWKGL